MSKVKSDAVDSGNKYKILKDWKDVFAGGSVSVDDLYGFSAGIDGLKRILPNLLRAAVSESMDIRFKWTSLAFWQDYCKIVRAPALIVPVKAMEWSGSIAIVFRSDVIYYLVESGLGGGAAEGGLRIDRLGFTKFEKEIGDWTADIVLSALRLAFNKISSTAFRKGEAEFDPEYISHWSGEDRISWLQVNISDGEGKSGVIDIIFPHASLRGDAMRRPVTAYSVENDLELKEKMVKALEAVEVVARVEIGNMKMTIDKIDNLKVGDTLMLNQSESDRADLVIDDFVFGKVELGQINGNIAGHIVDAEI